MRFKITLLFRIIFSYIVIILIMLWQSYESQVIEVFCFFVEYFVIFRMRLLKWNYVFKNYWWKYLNIKLVEMGVWFNRKNVVSKCLFWKCCSRMCTVYFLGRCRIVIKLNLNNKIIICYLILQFPQNIKVSLNCKYVFIIVF